MKKFKYILMLMLGVVIATTSCNDDEPGLIEQIQSTPNVVSFYDNNFAYGAIADGEEYTIEVEIFMQGPTTDDLSGDVTLKIAADETSTAVAGTHFRLDTDEIVLKEDHEYRGIFTFTMLTQGIQTPLESSPVVKLKMVSATGAENVVEGGKLQTVTLDYACPSFLEGPYTLEISYDGNTDFYGDEYLTKVGIGLYQGTYVAKWGNLNTPPGYGLEFKDVCGVVTVPSQLLAGYYGNDFYGTQAGSVDPETGVITIYYFVASGSGSFDYTAVYTPK